MRALALLAVAALAAGCVAAPEAPVEPQLDALAAFIDPIVDDHAHNDFAEHALSTASMSLVGHTTMSDDGKPYSYIGEMDSWGNMSVVQVLGRGSMPGFVILDTSDPAAPVPIGRAEMPFSYVVDVKWSPDGKSIFAASQAGPQRSRGHAPPTDDPATAALTGNGFTQFDVSDPTKPVAVAGGLAEPTGCHMLSVQQRGERTIVYCVANVVYQYEYQGEGAWVQTNTFSFVRDQQGLDRVVDEAVAAGAGAPNALLLSAEPHDVTIMADPKEPGRRLMVVSYWDLGLRIYDVTDPDATYALGGWSGQGAQVYEGNVHGAQFALLDGKRVLVVGPELLGAESRSALWVLDAEDLSAPTLVAEWSPPGDHATQGLLLTVHQFQVVGTRVYLAYNHAGVWVLDLAAIVEGSAMADPARPEVLGYYLPHQQVELFDPDIAAVPNTWDVNVRDGRIFASDRYTGFYVLQYAGDAPGDASVSSVT